MSNDKVKELPRKGFRQERQPTKGEVQKENQTLAQQLQTKIMNVEMQMQFIGQMMGQTMGQVRQVAPEVAVLTELAASETLPAGTKASKGDLVMVDYAGVLINDDGSHQVDADGLESYFQGGSGLKFVVKGLGGGTLLPEFEDAIEGKQVGDTFETSLTFPEKYAAKELAGKKAKFTIHIHRISRLLAASPVEQTIRANEAKKAEVLKAKAAAKAAEEATKKAEAPADETLNKAEANAADQVTQ